MRGSKTDKRDSLPQSRIVQTLHALARAYIYSFSLFKDDDAAASKCIRVYTALVSSVDCSRI